MVKLAGVPPDLNVPVLQHGQAGRIIPAVFQPLQTVQDDGGSILLADVTYNPAHNSSKASLPKPAPTQGALFRRLSDELIVSLLGRQLRSAAGGIRRSLDFPAVFFRCR
jgi:hypothetical protein